MKNLAAIALLIFALIMLHTTDVFSQQTITIQGVLTNSSGVPLPDGTYEIEFNLYETESGGSTIWTETHTVFSVDGVFSANLAETVPFSVDFSSQYWLGISIESGTEVSPRIEFSWSPYSFYALTIADNSVTSEKIENGTIAAEDLSQMGAGEGQALIWSGTAWIPSDIAEGDESDPIFTVSPAAGITGDDITNWDDAYSWGDHALVGYLTEYTETDPIYTASPANGIAAADITNWDNAYSWGDHALVGYLTEYTETDPIFIASPANGIAAADITNWDDAYGWGDHALVGYLTEYTETDPIFTASPANGIAAADITNWDDAYGWGDHALVGYLTEYTETDPVFTASPSSSVTETDIDNWDESYGWGDHSTAGYLTGSSEASGEVTGTFSDLVIEDDVIDSDNVIDGSISGADISDMSANEGEVLKWNGSQWAPATDEGGEGVGDNWGTQSVISDASLTGTGILGNALGIAQHGASSGQVLIWDGSDWLPGDISSEETDPSYTSSPSSSVTEGDINNWNAAYGWGDHALAGYLTEYTETDPIFTASPANGIAAADIANWNTAYGWGDHAAEGYIASGDFAGGELSGTYPNPEIANNSIDTDNIINGAVRGVDLNQMGASAGQTLVWNGTQWTNGLPSGFVLPFSGTVSTPVRHAFDVTQDNSQNSAIKGTNSDYSVYGILGYDGQTGVGDYQAGVYGESSGGETYGFLGNGWDGVNGYSDYSGGYGLYAVGGPNSSGAIHGFTENPDEYTITAYHEDSRNEGALANGVFGVLGINRTAESPGISYEDQYAGVLGVHNDTENWGFLGNEDYGVYGKNEANGNYGYLGGSINAVFGYNDSGTQGVIASSSYGVVGWDIPTTNWGALGYEYWGAYGVFLANGNKGYLGTEHYGVKGQQHGSVAGPGVYGICGTGADITINTNCGVYGKDLTSENYGYLGGINYGAYAENATSLNYAYLASENYAFYGANDAMGHYAYIGGDNYAISAHSGDAGDPAIHGMNTSGCYTNLAGGTYGLLAKYNSSSNYGIIGASTYGVYGINVTSGCYGYLGTADYGVDAHTGNISTDIAVRGYHGTSDNYGYLGTENYGVYGYDYSSNNFAYLGGPYGSLGMYADNGNYGVLGYSNAGVYGFTENPGDVAVGGVNDNGNIGYLGGDVTSIGGVNASVNVPGTSYTNQYAGVLGFHSNSQNFGMLGNANYGVYGKDGGTGNFGYLGGETYAVYGIDGSGYNYGYLGGLTAVGGVASYFLSPAVYGSHTGYNTSGWIAWLAGVYGEDGGTGNFGNLGTSVNGVYGENQTTEVPGDPYDEKYAGVLGYHEDSENYGFLGNANYGVYGYAATSSDQALYGANTHGEFGYIGGAYGVYGEDPDGNYGYIGGSSYGIYAVAATSSDRAGGFNGDVYVYGNNQLTINTATDDYALQIANSTTNSIGRARAQQWATYSDIRIKSNFRTLEYGLADVLKLQPKNFYHHSSHFDEETGELILEDGEETIGFIAQELYEVIPEAAYKPEDETKSLWGICPDNLIPVLVKAIQEQNETIESQKSEIEILRQEIELIKQQLKDIK